MQNILSDKLIALNRDNGEELGFLLNENSKYIAGDNELDVSLKRTDDGFSLLSINGVTYPVEIVSVHQNVYEILVNGVSYNFSVETPFSLERKKMLDKQMGESSTILIKAPMPGKILDVLVKTGDTVKSGDTLLILEAMKMQNAILASTKAIVKKVVVRSGDTTSKSDLLIELEKE
ncbi:MAG: biotin/lipoyl-containing protein [Dysgonomonas sp.]|nr:biotin/lipoyl-containing protein [Dysgonomonas sp.]